MLRFWGTPPLDGLIPEPRQTLPDSRPGAQPHVPGEFGARGGRQLGVSCFFWGYPFFQGFKRKPEGIEGTSVWGPLNQDTLG